MASERRLFVGTAGWAIPKPVAGEFSAVGALLTRYATRFNGVEINSTFYRSHRAATYARWRDSVPTHFRFVVKLRRTISHEKMLVDAGEELEAFLLETSTLGGRRGPILIQLPPKLTFDIDSATTFLRVLREQFDGDVVVEPRHASWFTTEADDALSEYRAARAGADPPRAPRDGFPGGYRGLSYLRLHGAPRVYFSSYDAVRLTQVAAVLTDSSSPTWCIFDNTASGAAAANALDLSRVHLRDAQ